MITLLSVLTWIKVNLKVFLIILIIVLSVVIFWFWKANQALKIDNARVSENFIQKDKQVSQLNLTVDEFNNLQTKAKYKIDSLLKVIKEKPKNIIQATDIEIQYRDTGSTKTVYLPAKKQADASFRIPVSVDSDCWGMKGVILSKDSSSKFNVTEKTASNSIQLLVIKRKHFLWWTIRPEQFKAFNTCGEQKVTQVNFQK